MKTETKTILLTLNELKRNKIRVFDQNEFLHDGNRSEGMLISAVPEEDGHEGLNL